MSHHNFQNFCRLALTLWLALFASTSSATTVLPFEAVDLVDGAELIFVGTAFDEVTMATGDGQFAFRYVTFTVEETLKGETLSDTFTLRLAGGEVGHSIIEVVGMPEFELGGRYLLFVERNGDVGCPVLGWWQGQYRVLEDAGEGNPVLVDHAGRPVIGLSEGRWQLIPDVAPEGPEAELLWAEGVTIEGMDAEATGAGVLDAKKALRPASVDDLLEDLRALIGKRQAAKTPSFVSGKAVRSADPITDTPATFGTPGSGRPRR